MPRLAERISVLAAEIVALSGIRRDQLRDAENKARQSAKSEIKTCQAAIHAAVRRAHGGPQEIDENHDLKQGPFLPYQASLASWSDAAWKIFSPAGDPDAPSGLTRIGEFRDQLVIDSEGTSVDLDIPAVVPILGSGNLLIKAHGDKLEIASDAIQSAIFRLVAARPPGHVKLWLIDPVGFGRSFSTLSELSEKIRGRRMAHEESQINAFLKELSDIMATLTQDCLQDDFGTIQEYNKNADLKEPYRILGIAGFPTGFSSEAIERVEAIVDKGPAIGVHVLMTLDTESKPAFGADLNAIARLCTVAELSGRDSFWLSTNGLERVPLILEEQPPHNLVESVAGVLNLEAIAAERDALVNIDQFISPEPWKHSTAGGISIPVGRAGARDVQHFDIGGAANVHHALIAGKTGMGKTVFLHDLIVGAATKYSPDELELYLIDFKEGTEFQVYDKLPHARVVALESEPEFGVSVLEAIVEELERRGELPGFHKLAEYREENPDERLPRILLIADEFQVFFSCGGRLASRSRALFDDLVRRGRSFGIHLVLASQTLGSTSGDELSSATLSQIGLRVAFQLDERDAYKVLSRDNDDAKRLSRPGQAIYNPVGGQRAGNERFQAAFVSRDDVENRVRVLADMAKNMGFGGRARWVSWSRWLGKRP